MVRRRVIENRAYTPSECLVLLAQRVAKDYEEPIAKCVDNWTSLPLEVRSASISLAYNICYPSYCKSSVARELNQGDIKNACDKFLLWSKARINGRLREVQGLLNRRQDERELCLAGVNKTEAT